MNRSAAIVALAAALAACGDARPQPGATPTDAAVPSAPPEPEPRRHLALVTPRHAIDLTTKVSGTITLVEVALGERIEAGQTVAVLDNEDLRHALRIAEASAASARAQVSDADLKHTLLEDKARRADALGEVLSEVERTESSFDARRAAAAERSARSTLSGRVAEVVSLRDQVDALTLRAPFAAEVAALYYSPGQRVPSEAAIVRLVSLERVVRFAVDAQEAHQFEVGTKVEFAHGDRQPVTAVVIAQAPEIDAAGMLIIEASIADAEAEAALRTGTRGYVHPKRIDP